MEKTTKPITRMMTGPIGGFFDGTKVHARIELTPDAKSNDVLFEMLNKQKKKKTPDGKLESPIV